MTNLDFDDNGIYNTLLEACIPHQVDPSSSIDSENYFRELLDAYTGTTDMQSVSEWLKNHIKQNFQYLSQLPIWLQNADWQYEDGHPMIFVGQIDIQHDVNKLFHDDTTFFIFYGKQGKTKVVVQQL